MADNIKRIPWKNLLPVSSETVDSIVEKSIHQVIRPQSIVNSVVDHYLESPNGLKMIAQDFKEARTANLKALFRRVADLGYLRAAEELKTLLNGRGYKNIQVEFTCEQLYAAALHFARKGRPEEIREMLDTYRDLLDSEEAKSGYVSKTSQILEAFHQAKQKKISDLLARAQEIQDEIQHTNEL